MSTLKIDQEGLVGIIRQTIAFDGLEKARELFERLCVMFATFEGWPDAARAITEVLVAERQRKDEEERQKRESQQERSSVYIVNEVGRDARSYKTQVDQLIGLVENDANVTHTIIKGGVES